MPRFIELDCYDFKEKKSTSKRIINVDYIRELSGPHTLGTISVTRVHLWDNDFIDVTIPLFHLRDEIENCKAFVQNPFLISN